MTKYYAVRHGRIPGIYTDWNRCKEQIQGFSNASYKKFDSEEEAKAYIIGNESESEDSICLTGYDDVIHAYVDGSFDRESGIYGSGVVVLYKEKEILLFRGGNEESLASMHNVAGEILGAEMAMEWVEKHLDVLEKTVLILYHDYQGIARWASGEWKAQKKGTQDYVKKYKYYQEKFTIQFVKVKAHSGVKYNEIADELAKKAVEEYKQQNKNK